jgi:CCR4-NOT transcription complex subunit 1
MIHNLFDEYRFFHKYPENELKITGKLFGAVINHELVLGITLGIALRYVLEALKRPTGKLYRFGWYALKKFRNRLPTWP